MTAPTKAHRTIAPQLLVIAAALAAVLFFTIVSPGSPPRGTARFVPDTLGDQPPGAVVLAREDGALAAGLAVALRAGHLLLVATVFGRDGSGAGGLRSSFEVRTSERQTITANGAPCTAGCYEAIVPASGRPTTATVVLNHEDRVTFALPSSVAAPSALSLVRDAEAQYRHVRTLVTHERLASDLTHAVYTTYYAAAPDKLRFQIRGGLESIIIGNERWDRQPGGSWQRSAQTPIQPITPYWTPLVQDATVLGRATVDGRPCWVVAFADPQTPGFFTIWVDAKTHRTLQLQMTAAAHFMHHSYGPFNASLAIRPPAAR